MEDKFLNKMKTSFNLNVLFKFLFVFKRRSQKSLSLVLNLIIFHSILFNLT
ncbi:hypothetical protein LEP1GSC173_2515 [Leptospira interrogans str. HAI1594]|uniref:Uncharacterized protein n=4 Tax=Leptospira interrogans TaxID=173 RepID=M6R9U4_LEPIR|nr:hypothetical protein LEP1GSC104_2745 [Leptospira interrogans str. UI 12621]EKO98860.1 hypothetical protein LEP1GSC057_3322 [Leptospira interrogans str. Brem 329]EKP22973.1 hypothetical protein LEP1GSC117_2855 [Leptospira interrogans serovar Icterohaemorrhagiae str. Verdun LP]EKP73963.1 hypothetical protein LEP1GSC173_2515 [Leptospira interrogans str. HAI1594]EKR16465.1 hypothetical protein LEP1GSC019_2404 [Leptospira interrogans serovar Pyrogenes str. 2006006960]EKR29003.1 hypothetical prot